MLKCCAVIAMHNLTDYCVSPVGLLTTVFIGDYLIADAVVQVFRYGYVCTYVIIRNGKYLY